MPKSQKPRHEYNPNKSTQVRKQTKDVKPTLLQEATRELVLTLIKWSVPIALGVLLCYWLGLDIPTVITLLSIIK